MPRINPRSDSYEALLWDVVTNAQRYLPTPGDSVLDLGAHFGMFSLYCAARGCHVKAYEPNPEAMAELVQMVAVAEEIGLGHIYPVCRAVWSNKGYVSLRKQSDSTATCITVPQDFDSPAVVCETLRDAMDERWMWDCVKVDVEGAEAEIFASSTQEDFDRINFLTIEIHNNLLSLEVRTALIEKLKAAFPNHGTIPVKVNGVATGDLACLYCWR